MKAKKYSLLSAVVIILSLISIIIYKELTHKDVVYSLPKHNVLLSDKELQAKGNLEKRPAKATSSDDFFQKSYDTIGVYVYADFGENDKMFGVVGYSEGNSYITIVSDYELAR